MRSTTFWRCLFASAVLLAIGVAPAAAQNLVRGIVVDENDKPVEGATVHFEAIDFVNKRDTKSDKKGEFLFMGLTTGEYKITASKEGVGTETRSFKVGAETAKQRLDFKLATAKTVVTKVPAAAPGSLEAEAAAAAAKGKELAALQALASSAMAAQQAGQHQSAITSFNELVGKVPTCADCYMHLGSSYLELKQYSDAETAFKKSIELRPTVEAYTQLGRTYNTQKKFDLAAEATTKAAELAAGTPATPATPAKPGAGGATTPTAIVGAAPTSETLYNQGVIQWNSGKYAEAQKLFDAAVKANPKNAEAQYQLGMANLNLGQIPAARAAFEAYLEAAPDGPKAAEVKTFLTQLPKK